MGIKISYAFIPHNESLQVRSPVKAPPEIVDWIPDLGVYGRLTDVSLQVNILF